MDGLLGGDLNDQLNSLGANPLFNMGMGLMQNRYDSSVNPYAAIMGGLGNSRQGTQKDAELERAEAQRKALEQYFAMLMQGQQQPQAPAPQPAYGGYGGGPGMPEDSELRDYVNQEIWKYQLGQGGR